MAHTDVISVPQGVGVNAKNLASVHNPFGLGTAQGTFYNAAAALDTAVLAQSIADYEPEDGPRICKFIRPGNERCPNFRGEEDYCHPHRKHMAKLADSAPE